MSLDLTLPEGFLRLGMMGWPLAACSVLALALCLERSVFFLASRRRNKVDLERLCTQLYTYKAQPKPLRDEALNVLMLQLQGSYLSALKSLRTIGAISPMIGLLGTILGIIAAFKVIALHPGPVSPNMIADGLGEAMFTTAAGLMIALPSLLMAHLFQSLAERQLAAMSLHLNKRSLAMALAVPEHVDTVLADLQSAGDKASCSGTADSDSRLSAASVKSGEKTDVTQREWLIENAARYLT